MNLPQLSPRLTKTLGFAFVIAVFGFALVLLHHELRNVHFKDVLAAVSAVERPQLLLAAVFTALSYAALTGYDFTAVRFVGRPLPYRNTAFPSFVSYAFSNTLGLSVLGGVAFRYRMYAAFGIGMSDVVRITLFCAFTFWVGLVTVGGAAMTFVRNQALPFVPFAETWLHVIGIAALVLVVAYLGLCWRRQGYRLGWRQWVVTIPPPRLAGMQIGFSTFDWLCASAACYWLFPRGIGLDYPHFLAIYCAAIVVGLASHVPGGLGVFETVFIVALRDTVPATTVLGSLLAFRGVYYVLPLFVGMTAFAVSEARAPLRKMQEATQHWLPAVVPRAFAAAVFVGGIVLLFSGVTPSVPGRRAWIEHVLPSPVIESVHLFASLIGFALLILARGLQRRLDAAYVLSLALLLVGAALSLAKGLDYEEAIILTTVFVLMLPCRREFYRKASLFEPGMSAGWIAAIGASLFSMIWLMVFAHKHTDYTRDIFWRFTMHGEAPRALRASFAVVSGAFLVGFAYLLRPHRLRLDVSEAEVDEDVARIVAESPQTYAHLALVGDKAILLNEAKTAFIMYAVEGHSLVAMGDPVGPPEETRELLWRFRELADAHGLLPVFYQVDGRNLEPYLELGLTFAKLGEEAEVPLADFSLEGKRFKGLRSAVNKVLREGFSFAVVPAEETAALMPQLARVSSDWLEHKRVREKGFSLGRYREDYLARGPIAVVRKDDRIVAFANVWTSSPKAELSVDLMRFDDDAPHGIMDFLFAQLMLWGKENGYETFNLGMAPFSGIEARRLAPRWTRLGNAVYRYGEHFYNFKGLREYKEKFHPRWRSKFLASPPGLSWPIALANVVTLISGGVKGVVSR